MGLLAKQLSSPMRSQNRECFHPSQFIGDQIRAHLARSYLFPFDMASGKFISNTHCYSISMLSRGSVLEVFSWE